MNDLAAIEDSEPDYLTKDKKIVNWSKRKAAVRVFSEVEMMQKRQQEFDGFVAVEPLFSFLSKLASVEEAQLLELSVAVKSEEKPSDKK